MELTRTKSSNQWLPSKRQPYRYIPEEIVVNILPNLPPKSLARFRCVSKRWRRLISQIKTPKLLFMSERPDSGIEKPDGDFVYTFSTIDHKKVVNVLELGCYCYSMATPSRSESSGSHSWWSNSHVSPNGSKWLQKNISEIDSKVKEMIKLIEVDADTFASRAEMYYKRRPELMKLAEEFYRSYRDLAERYSCATGMLRQSPPVPFQLPDDSPGMFLETGFHTPEVPIQSRPYPRDIQKDDAMEFSSSQFPLVSLNGAYTKENKLKDILVSEGEVKKGLDFLQADEKKQTSTEIEVLAKLEKDGEALKEGLAKVDAETEVESKDYGAQEKNAESEVKTLKEAFCKLEVAEKEVSLLQYKLFLSKNGSLALMEKNRALEEEIYLLLDETLFSSTLSFIMNNIINDKSAELKEVTYNLDVVNGDIRRLMDNEIANGKLLLCQKELELSEVTRKLIATENEKTALKKAVVDLKTELEELQMTSREPEMQILKVSESGKSKTGKKGRSTTDTGKKVLLRDYFYVNDGKRSMKKMKAQCVCAQPSTSED